MSDDKEKVVNALGGTRGLIDSGLPALVFMVSFYVTKEIRPSVTYALILSAGLALARLIKKTQFNMHYLVCSEWQFVLSLLLKLVKQKTFIYQG